jgi:hypothetical protein
MPRSIACPRCGRIFSLPDSGPLVAFACSGCRETIHPAPSPTGVSPFDFGPPLAVPYRDADEDRPVRRQRRKPMPRDEYDDRPVRRSRSRAFECPFCHTEVAPIFRSRISTLGWIVVVVGTITTCFGGLFGLLFKEDYRVCPACNGKL